MDLLQFRYVACSTKSQIWYPGLRISDQRLIVQSRAKSQTLKTTWRRILYITRLWMTNPASNLKLALCLLKVPTTLNQVWPKASPQAYGIPVEMETIERADLKPYQIHRNRQKAVKYAFGSTKPARSEPNPKISCWFAEIKLKRRYVVGGESCIKI